MIRVDLRAVTQPVGIMRIIATLLSCMSFSLAASAVTLAKSTPQSPYWAWCIFTWCFCFFFTFLIIILEFTTFNGKLPFAWDDFTAAFAILAGLMYFAASIIYPSFFTCKNCYREIGVSVVSWVCFGVYVGEVVLTRLRPSGQTSGFLSTVPGIMKMVEVFIACLIFTSLEPSQFRSAGQQWCVAVYSLCFIFAILIILLTLGQLTSFFPFSFDKLVVVYNILAGVMYITAMVIWPLYSFRKAVCSPICTRSNLVVVTIMTVLNCIVYILDCVYSVRLVFFVSTSGSSANQN